MALGVAIMAMVAGFFPGQAYSLGMLGCSSKRHTGFSIICIIDEMRRIWGVEHGKKI